MKNLVCQCGPLLPLANCPFRGKIILLAALYAHFIEHIHFVQARASWEVLSNNNLHMLNPEYSVLTQEKPLHCRLENSLLRFNIYIEIYIAGAIWLCLHCVLCPVSCVFIVSSLCLNCVFCWRFGYPKWEAVSTVKSLITGQLWYKNNNLLMDYRERCLIISD